MIKKAPIEDIGIVILDNRQITVTLAVLEKFLANNVAVITCDDTHHPTGLLMTLDGNTLQSQKHNSQIEASIPLKKSLWQQTIVAKIENQSSLLQLEGHNSSYLLRLAKDVRSGDSGNNEAQAAAYYWKHIFPDFLEFKRDRLGKPPNNLLNYGYSILRALMARCLVASGLLPTFGIFHRNQYNSYCLADDIMEPYRPFVDKVVCDIIKLNGRFLDMTPKMKQALLGIPAMDVKIGGQRSPLMIAVQRTTSSLAKCFSGESRKLAYPEFFKKE